MLIKIQQFFARNGGGKPFDAVTQKLGVLDRRALEIELDLRVRAKEQGKGNLPPPDQRDKDALAMNIDSYLAQAVRAGRDELNNYMAALANTTTGDSWDVQITKRDTAFRAALTRLVEAANNGFNNLYTLRTEVTNSEREYQNFIKKNNITHLPVHAANRMRSFAWVLVLGICEALFNAFALGSAHPEGPVGVLLETVIIAAVNVAIFAGPFGYGLRQFSRRRWASMFFGGVLVVGIAALAVVFNFIIAHYRDTLLNLQTNAGTGNEGYLAAYGSLFRDTLANAFSAQWYAFGGMMSFLLVFIGLGMFGFAAIKWRYMEDSFPGYSRLVRTQDERNREYADLMRDEQNELRTIADNETAKISGMHEMAVASLRRIWANEVTCNHLREKYVTWVGEVTVLGNALYAQYREINMQYREGVAPTVFEQPFALPNELIEPPVLPLQNVPVPEEQVDVQRMRADKQYSLIAKGHNDCLARYQTIGELAPQDSTDGPAMPYDNAIAKINADLQAEARTL